MPFLELDHIPIGNKLQKLETGSGVRYVCAGGVCEEISAAPKT